MLAMLLRLMDCGRAQSLGDPPIGMPLLIADLTACGKATPLYPVLLILIGLPPDTSMLGDSTT
jgi:hypothetical protein